MSEFNKPTEPKTQQQFYDELRNKVLEEVAREIEVMFRTPFGKDTIDSFASYVRRMKKMTQDELKLVFDALQECTTYAVAGGFGKRATAHRDALDILEKASAQEEALQALHAENERLGLYKDAYAQPEQEPVAWKLMPRDATDAMLKAMDGCSTEGYDERLYAGHAASVYMAAWDALDTHPPQRTWVGLTDDEIALIAADCSLVTSSDFYFAKAIESKMKELNDHSI